MLLLQQMAVLFIYMVIGYGPAKKGIFDEEFSKKVSWIVINVANPALTLSAVVNEDGSITGRDLALTAAAAVAILGGLVLLSRILPLVMRVRREEKNAYILMTAFNNIGFMGFPVIAAVYGEQALLYAAVFSMIFNVLMYTYGIQTIQEEKKGGLEWDKIFNIGTFSSIAAIVVYLGGIPVPRLVKTVISGLGNLAPPLSMMVIGISLAAISKKELLMDGRLLTYSLVKLLVVPIAAMCVINRIIDNEILCGVCMVMLATPSASMNAMLASQYGSEENAELAAKGVALTTVLSVVTIPAVSALVF